MSNSVIRVAVSGANGLMGKQIIKSVINHDNIILGAALEKKKSDVIGIDVGNILNKRENLDIFVSDNISKVSDDFDIFIDFSNPKSTMDFLFFCEAHMKPMVIGTTGISEKCLNIIKSVSQKIPIVLSENFSVGISFIINFLEKISSKIKYYSDIDIIEYHHRNKKDSPSGTSILIGNTIANSVGFSLKECLMYNHFENIKKRKNNKIYFSSIRSGDIVGEHTVMFSMKEEIIEIKHRVSTRMVYAYGAIQACLWLNGKKNGFFTMSDVLELNNK